MNEWECTGSSCPQDGDPCGYGLAPAGGTVDVDITFSDSVTGFTTNGISVTNGSVQSLVGTGDSYIATITSNCDNCLVEVSVGANVVDGGNGAAGPLYIPWGEDYFFLCDFLSGIPALRWSLDEVSGHTAHTSTAVGDCDPVFPCLPVNGAVANATFVTNGMQCPATLTVKNLYSLSLNGTNNYIEAYAVGMSTIGLWVRSFSADPANQTIYHFDSGADTLVISYDRTVPNYLSAVTQSQAVRSDTPFVLTDWNNIIVRVSSEGIITDLLVNGVYVLAAGNQSFVASLGTPQKAVVGAKRTQSGYENYFHGYVDDVFIPMFPALAAEIWSIVGTEYINACVPPPESRYYITEVPNQIAAFSVTNWDDDTNLKTTGKAAGNYFALLKKNSVPIVRALTQLTENRTWENVVADTNPTLSKVVVHFPSAENDIEEHGHNPSNDKHTIYAQKNETDSFRVCPQATTLEGVTNTCPGGVHFPGPFPQTKTVDDVSVQVGTTTIDSVTYWYASGLTGSGGQGEEGGETPPVPFFPLWSIPIIGFIGWYMLKREGWLEA